MESALSPREIQARIRAGESVAEVAKAAGVPNDQIEVYAGPVLAEREHAALMARTAPVRRRGEASAHRMLGDVVTDALAVRDIEPELIRWDAWRGEDRRWTVRAAWSTSEGDQHADFDLTNAPVLDGGRRSRATLIDERPRRRSVERPRTRADDRPERRVGDRARRPGGRRTACGASGRALGPHHQAARRAPASGKDTSEPDDYTPAELAQVDGVYEILPPPSDMDVLYEMLAGFNEDSVRIYTGLTQPVSTPNGEQPDEEVPKASPVAKPRPKPGPKPKPVVEQQPAPVAEPEKPAAPAEEPPVAPEVPVAPQPQATAPEPAPAEPEQDALVDEPEPAPARPAKKRKRASVPTWDEIMFGGPHLPKNE